MTDLRDCTVLVHDVNEYKAIVRIAKKEGFKWASGSSLDRVLCTFPTRLDFGKDFYVCYESWAGACSRDYPNCMELVRGVEKLILVRQRERIL